MIEDTIFSWYFASNVIVSVSIEEFSINLFSITQNLVVYMLACKIFSFTNLIRNQQYHDKTQ